MALIIWRHPKPKGAAGRCIGQTDLSVDPRRIRRLARRIQRTAQQQHLPKIIHVSPLQRSRKVGEYLQRLGWQLNIDPALMEFDFGYWDGLPWKEINPAEMDDWCDHFATARPGQGENLDTLFTRVEHWLQQHASQPVLAVGHAGWINAALLLYQQRGTPQTAADWPSPVSYGTKCLLDYTGR